MPGWKARLHVATTFLAVVLSVSACGLLTPDDDREKLTEPTTAVSTLQLGPPDSYFQKVVLAAGINQPTELAVAPDRRVFFLDRTGKVRVWLPASQTTVTAATLSVDITGNHGLLGLALDPAFAGNKFVYLYYSPLTPSVNRVSRFTAVGNLLDPASERVLLEFATQRQCCHEGGSIAFGPDGNLYVSTGDNTNAFGSSGYSPIDERSGREGWDAQRSTANTQDLRGKILRLHPETDGSYTIPNGNLFSSSASGKPEIYAMGMRNPFRISVDRATGWLYFGDVGPDAVSDSEERGPRGYDEFNQVKSAGNYGWPYCIATNRAYKDFNYATGTSGPAFSCSAPVNDSPNNTGSKSLPAARAAWIWYPDGLSAEFPQLGNSGGRAAMMGPVYHFDAGLASSIKLPADYDNRAFIYDWVRDWIQTVGVSSTGAVLDIVRFLPSFTFSSPIDLEVGPDGALYLLEWGQGEGHESGADAKLSRIEFKGTGGASPIAKAKATPDAGPTPLTVVFSSAGSVDPEGGALTYAWDFTANGTIDSRVRSPSFTYTTAGDYTAKLTVTDPEGKTGVATVLITAGNSRPRVTLSRPLNGGFFSWGEQVSFVASVTDAEDGSTPTGISCSSVQIVPGIGHDDHTHTDPSVFGCSGTLTLPSLPGDHANDNVSYVVQALYTDEGAGPAGRLTGKATARLQPKRKQAEFFTSSKSVLLQRTGDPLGGGQNLTGIHNGDWIAFTPMNLSRISAVRYRTASGGPGGKIEVRVNSTTGTLLSTATIPVTGGWQTYTNVRAAITNPGGTRTLYFVFKGSGTTRLFNLNWIDFLGAGVSTPVSLTASTLR
jgi:cytochrome c